MHRNYLLTGSLIAAIAVALGAFGAHGLKQLVPAETVVTFQTGVQYQFYHALALLITGIIYERYPYKLIKRSAICFITGIILFSGSLYLLTLVKATETVGLNGLGIITPVGGLFFIAGWLLLFAGIYRKSGSSI
jgi:uncharacterized membrane protein YgdD (TMEM256/DUF423 family)